MLDPKLVPWNDVVLATVVALIVCLPTLIRQTPSLLKAVLYAAAPVAGLVAAIVKSQSWPDFPPKSATTWMVYFAIIAIVPVIITWLLSRRRWWWLIALLIVIGHNAGLWYGLYVPLRRWDDEIPRYYQEVSLALAAIGVLLATDTRKRSSSLVADFAPWTITLVATSMVLALTGAATIASGSLGALVLCFAVMPVSIILLIKELVSGSHAETFCSNLRQPQVVLLPIAFALPVMIIGGALYAYTPWQYTLMLLASPIVGVAALRLFQFISAKKCPVVPGQPVKVKLVVVAILIGMIAAAIPAGYATVQCMNDAEEEAESSESLYY